MTTNSAREGSGKKARDYLLVARIGLKSLHAQWLAGGADRNYDVFFSSYDAQIAPIQGDGVYFEYRAGSKVAGYDGLLREYSDFFSQYKYIAFFDDDIEASPACISGLFSRCDQHNLKIAQPALTWDSHFTYAALLQQRGYGLRYLNFIEMMCPIFRRDILERVAPLYALGYESGIDLIWCNLVAEGPRDFAVIDEFAVRHTEPVGGNKSANGFVDGRLYEDDIHAILALFQLPWLRATPFAAIDHAGREIRSPLRLLFGAFTLFAAAPRRQPVAARLRAIVVHLRHLWQGAAGNRRISLPAALVKSLADAQAQASARPREEAGRRPAPRRLPAPYPLGLRRQADRREAEAVQSGLAFRRKDR